MSRESQDDGEVVRGISNNCGLFVMMGGGVGSQDCMTLAKGKTDFTKRTSREKKNLLSL